MSANKQPTLNAQIKKAKEDLHYWQGMARMSARSYSRTLQRVAEVELVVAQLEAEKNGGGLASNLSQKPPELHR